MPSTDDGVAFLTDEERAVLEQARRVLNTVRHRNLHAWDDYDFARGVAFAAADEADRAVHGVLSKAAAWAPAPQPLRAVPS